MKDVFPWRICIGVQLIKILKINLVKISFTAILSAVSHSSSSHWECRLDWNETLEMTLFTSFKAFIFPLNEEICNNLQIANEKKFKHHHMMVAYLCPKHAKNIMSTCNITYLCSITMLTNNLIIWTCNLIMLYANRIMLPVEIIEHNYFAYFCPLHAINSVFSSSSEITVHQNFKYPQFLIFQ